MIEKLLKHWKLLLLIFIGILLRFLFLGNASLWFDEAASYLVASSDLKKFMPILNLVELKPPLFFIILHFLLKANESIIFMRIFPALMGSLNIVLFFKVCRKLLGDNYWIALVICVFSPFWIHESQNVRMYSLMLAIILASTIIFLEILFKYEKKHIVIFILFNTIGLYTHYIFAFFYFSELLVLVLLKGRTVNKYLYALFPFAFFLPYCIHIPNAVRQKAILSEYDSLSFHDNMRVFGEFFIDSNFFTWTHTSLSVCIGVFVMILISIGIWFFYKKREYKKAVVVASMILFPLIFMFAISKAINISLLKPRYLIIVTPFIYIAVAHSLTMDFVKKIIIPRVMIIAILIFYCPMYYMSRLNVDSRLDKYDLIIRELYQPEDIILHTEMWHYLPLRYYYTKDLKHSLLILKDRSSYLFLKEDSSLIDHSVIETPEQLQNLANKYIILVDPLKRFNMRRIIRIEKENVVVRWDALIHNDHKK